MFHAANLPIIGEFADPTLLAELAAEAEHAGWDGVFVWDTLLFNVDAMPPVLDPWAMLAVIATSTTHVKIGPMIAQLARRRPWEVARQVVTLDHLSHGRFILGAGLGYAGEADFGNFGLPSDARVRADLLDESLDVIAGLCSGELFAYRGRHYTIKETVFRPSPVQSHIPVWIGGYWPTRGRCGAPPAGMERSQHHRSSRPPTASPRCRSRPRRFLASVVMSNNTGRARHRSIS